MNKFVFDSSAILTLYYNEPGKQKVRTLLDRGQPLISSANLCEVLTKLVEDNLDIEDAWESFYALEIEVIDFDVSLAKKAADLRPKTRHLGLSFGDRACVALSMAQDATAVTADKSWANLDLCPVDIIR